MDAPAFRFDEPSHTYWLGERQLPGITFIMEQARLTDFSMVAPDVLAAAQARGTAVHLACALYDTDSLDYNTLDPRIYPYLDGWIKFREEFNYVPSFIEMPLHNGQYAGTPDRCGTIERNAGERRIAIVEIKTTKPGNESPGVQLAAQQHLFEHNKLFDKRNKILRYAVHLSDNGKYRLEHHNNPNDLAVFLSALTLYQYLQRRKA